MKKIHCILSTIFLSFLSCNGTPEPIINTTGVSLDLAQYRAKQVSNVVYDLSFFIPEQKEQPITSRLKLTVTIADLTNPLYLDFKEDSRNLQYVSVNQQIIDIQHELEHLIIPQKNLVIGQNQITIDFIAGDLSLNRNDDYLYTLLVPDRARTLFPCFDQPNIKANYNLSIRVPKDWTVLAGATLNTRANDGVNSTFIFNTSDLMSTYLFSFVAGNFKQATSTGKTRYMNLLYRESDPTKTTISIPSLFAIHKSSLDYLENYTDTTYPFQKFDFTTIPGFQYGGMEHTGAIQYRESVLFLDKNATQAQELSRAKLIAHETTHMWFGNLVTMEWFTDVWMKEVFANFMAGKIVNPLFKSINHDLQFMTAHYPNAYGVDRTQGSNPIRQDLDNLENAGSLYGSIIYNKAPIMMRQLELALGKDAFKKGIQSYIKQYSNSNSDWNGLVSILDRKTDLDLKQWSDVWVNSTGRPVFSEQITYDENQNISKFNLLQQAEDGTDKIWPQAFEIDLIYANHTRKIAVLSNSKSIELPKAIGLKKPKTILYNSNGFGYGVFPTNEKNLKISIALQNEVSRAHIYLNTFENVILGNSDVLDAYQSFLKGIEIESNELILGLLTRQTKALFWNHFSSTQRKEMLPQLEEILIKRLNSEASKNIKKTLFNTYRSIAYSLEGQATLYRIWKEEDHFDNLTLNQDDYIRLAQTLSLYGHPKAVSILRQAKDKLTNPDKRERFEFLEPALSNNSETRAAFFKAFRNPENRAKESWVQTAAANIHHPLHQEESIRNLNLSLELLEEIQQTGDIFFPKRWLDATIGLYTSKEAYDLVAAYLESHPNIDTNLKRKLLQASDKLYRKHAKK
ncbi:M1 family aminopeptidase [Flavobacteriaceae bacterium]|nr:M1 family aminopeptidase [Flavobacteriaceae bacterium]